MLALLMLFLPVLCWYCYAVLLLLSDVVQVNVLIGSYLHGEQKNSLVFLLSCSLSLLFNDTLRKVPSYFRLIQMDCITQSKKSREERVWSPSMRRRRTLWARDDHRIEASPQQC